MRDDPSDVEDEERLRKRIPAKVMWYAPIIPRLKHLFRNKEHAKLLRWHKEDRKVDNMLRHPTDGSQWREIDREFPDFAEDARNLRHGSQGILELCRGRKESNAARGRISSTTASSTCATASANADKGRRLVGTGWCCIEEEEVVRRDTEITATICGKEESFEHEDPEDDQASI